MTSGRTQSPVHEGSHNPRPRPSPSEATGPDRGQSAPFPAETGVAPQTETQRPALDLDLIEREITAANAVVRALCHGEARWTMSIPAEPTRDSDLVIGTALHSAEELVARVRALEADAARLREALDDAVRAALDGLPVGEDDGRILMDIGWIDEAEAALAARGAA